MMHFLIGFAAGVFIAIASLTWLMTGASFDAIKGLWR